MTGGLSTEVPSETDDERHVLPALDLFCRNDSFLHLEEDWRRGLGWWLIDAEGRRRVTIPDAIRLAPHAVDRELLLEAEQLVWKLEAEDASGESVPQRRAAISKFRREVDLAVRDGTGPTRAMMSALSVPGRTVPRG